ncbi:MAG: hypothetical protein ACRDY2_06340 [Acidimicrobiales bacterium]
MGVQVRSVDGAMGRARFVDVPFRLFGSEPEWVPPLRMSVRDRISPKHPAMEHQRVALWIAYEGGKAVGRIGACVDATFNTFQDLSWAWVGFFESVDRTDVADALFQVAWAWAGEQGMRTCVGPASFTTNDELGLLVEGREHPPTLMTTHNPAYYEKLWLGGGWSPTMDLWAWQFLADGPMSISERQRAVLDRLQARSPFKLRNAVMRDFDAEVARFFDIYNAAWSHNWGFAPMTKAEVSHLAKNLKLIVEPDLALLIDGPNGETVAAALAVPDVNQTISRLRNGRLLPFGWARLLAGRHKVSQARILLLGVRPEYEVQGVGPILYSTLMERMGADPRLSLVEASWTLGTNQKMNSALEAMGAAHHKTWRLYDRQL